MNAVDVLENGQQTVLQTLAEFPAAGVDTPGACGAWSVKDIIAHLASYEQVLVDVLSTLIGRHPTPSLDKFAELGVQFNDTEVGRRKGRTMREVLDEFHEAYAQVMELAAKISPERFRHSGILPWYGMEYDLNDFIIYRFYGHKREHSAQIAAFHDLLRRGSSLL